MKSRERGVLADLRDCLEGSVLRKLPRRDCAPEWAPPVSRPQEDILPSVLEQGRPSGRGVLAIVLVPPPLWALPRAPALVVTGVVMPTVMVGMDPPQEVKPAFLPSFLHLSIHPSIHSADGFWVLAGSAGCRWM